MGYSDFHARSSILLISPKLPQALSLGVKGGFPCCTLRSYSILMLLLAVFCGTDLAAKETEGEQQKLRYAVVYQGLLSSFIPIEIAKAELILTVNGAPIVESMVQVTSEPFNAAELFYPFRFAYQTWIDGSEGATLVALSLSRTRKRSKAEMLQFDPASGSILRYQLERRGEQPVSSWLDEEEKTVAGLAPPLELSGDLETLKQDPRWNPGSPVHFPLKTMPMDRLAMLHWIRNQPLRPGIELAPPVSNGGALRSYQVTVEAEETLVQGGRYWPAYRIRLQSIYNNDIQKPAVLLWLSADERRLPLRFLSERPFGLIEVALQEG